MSKENVEIVRSIYEAFNRDDWGCGISRPGPGCRIDDTSWTQGRETYRGREQCQGYFREWLTAFEASSVEPEELFESDDQVAVVLKVRARPKGSSAEIEIHIGHLWAFLDGKAVSLRMFPEPDKALEAAGLSE